MRRHELRDLDLVIEQRGDSLLGFAHDAKDNFIRSLFVLLPHWMTGILTDYQALSRDQLAKLERPDADWILTIGNFGTVFIIDCLVGNHDSVEQIIEQRSRRFLGGDSHSVLVDGRLTGDGGNILALLA